ncbi:hypothetical protein FC98_GL000685 [Lentilactobacillus kisonensis DSM 19906 = JCM 15041]|uniref:Uncharacterized protein n=1 Tax=Lentilactobacillus kisonensis DSM 19906 = JCM 15041 TaxID=1423766 RepID=A0A0R1NMU9_9LACO|nr:hypothetical protein FC98_GL000685 [Lentilactobacillus kisonensis DSM 19906 = JCM 15041]
MAFEVAFTASELLVLEAFVVVFELVLSVLVLVGPLEELAVDPASEVVAVLAA